MSEKQQQPETCTVINDKSQGSVATWFRCGEIFYYFVTNLLLSLPWKDF